MSEHKRRQREGGGNLTRMWCRRCTGRGYVASPAAHGPVVVVDYCATCGGAGEVRGGSGWGRWRWVWLRVFFWNRAPLMSMQQWEGGLAARFGWTPRQGFSHSDGWRLRTHYHDKTREERKREALAARERIRIVLTTEAHPGLTRVLLDVCDRHGAFFRWEAYERDPVSLWVELPSGAGRRFHLHPDFVLTDREATPENVRRFVREAVSTDGATPWEE